MEAQDVQQAEGHVEGASALQLSTDTWTQVLLPMLDEQGSAAAVAATCSQLRDLVFSSRQSLNVKALPGSSAGPGAYKSAFRNLGKHFPNCSAVSLELDSDNSVHGVPYMLPALARLPKLDVLSLTLSAPQQHLLACSMLRSMRAQLPALQSLAITMMNFPAWFGSATNVFCELGKMTQLTRLCLKVYDSDSRGLKMVEYAGIGQLSGLTQLQDLTIRMQDWDGDDRGFHFEDVPLGLRVSSQLLPSLTALTRLEADVCGEEALSMASSCVNLRHLAVCMYDMEVTAAHWASIAALTGLTHLHLFNADLCSATPEACKALSKLTQLQVLSVASMEYEFLPALVACAQLTEVCGSWFQWSQPSPTLELPQVATLSFGPNSSPFECFPNLRSVRADRFHADYPLTQTCAISTFEVESLCKHCTGLRELVLTAGDKVLSSSFSDVEDAGHNTAGTLTPEDFAHHTAALQAVTSLQQLTCLKFCPYNTYELLGLVQACSVLEGHGLRELHVVEGLWDEARVSQVATAAWPQLGRLRMLRKMVVVINCSMSCSKLGQQAEALLGALCGCGPVVLQLPGYVAPFEQARLNLQRAGFDVSDI